MELDSQRVWDYAGDEYVHRLIQNKTDGKLVEFPSPSDVVSTMHCIYDILICSEEEEMLAFRTFFVLTHVPHVIISSSRPPPLVASENFETIA
jgi:hypothetical protein